MMYISALLSLRVFSHVGDRTIGNQLRITPPLLWSMV